MIDAEPALESAAAFKAVHAAPEVGNPETSGPINPPDGGVAVDVGVDVGVAVGATVGVAVGATVGVAVGATVGVAVGATVGVAVGATVGVAVGVAVGIEHFQWSGCLTQSNAVDKITSEPLGVVTAKLAAPPSTNKLINSAANNFTHKAPLTDTYPPIWKERYHLLDVLSLIWYSQCGL